MIQDFIKKWNGKFCESSDPSNKNQCADLANQWRIENGWPSWTPVLYAKDFYKKADKNYEWIPNTPTGVPKEGDFVVWNIGRVGHVAIFIKGDQNLFDSFDQNYPVGSKCHIQRHDYKGVIGWLRYKGGEMIPQDKLNGRFYGSDGKVFYWIPDPDTANRYFPGWTHTRPIDEVIVPKTIETIKYVDRPVEKIVEKPVIQIVEKEKIIVHEPTIGELLTWIFNKLKKIKITRS